MPRPAAADAAAGTFAETSADDPHLKDPPGIRIMPPASHELQVAPPDTAHPNQGAAAGIHRATASSQSLAGVSRAPLEVQ